VNILRLELCGFKSFREKTVLSFNQPITAIVGSNGCGKSNVVDALYWVMGDMSPKHLRGSSMTDVIFSGSRDFAPMDMAEVTLVLDRDLEKDPPLPPHLESHKEIQITRRYYRGGESEYFINKVPCRLRDIQEFFMDTGLGAKAYSIIEQGAITRMVQQKPEERRVVIEEVAGIMKFKARRAETERKLEHTRTNLQRIDDILTDLQKQLGSLKRQAERAEKYSEYTTELKSLELRLSGHQWMEHSQKKSENAQEILELQGKLQSLEEALRQQKENLASSKEKLTGSENYYQEKRDQARREEISLKEKEGELQSLQTRKEALSQRASDSVVQREKLLERSGVLEQDIKKVEAELDTWMMKANDFQQAFGESLEKLQAQKQSTEDLRHEVDQERRQCHDVEIKLTRHSQELQNLQKTLGQLIKRRESLEIQIREVESQLHIHQAEKKSTEGFLQEAFSRRSDLEKSKIELDEKLAVLEQERSDLQKQRNERRDALSETKIRREHLEALEKNYEGVDAATKALALDLRERGENTALLADVVQAPTQYEKVLEAVFGRNLQRLESRNVGETLEKLEDLKNSGKLQNTSGTFQLWIPKVAAAKVVATEDALRAVQVKAAAPAPTDFALNAGEIYSPLESSAIAYASGEAATSERPAGDLQEISLSPEVTEEASPSQSLLEYLLNHPSVIGPLEKILFSDPESKPAWAELIEHVWVVRDSRFFSELLSEVPALPALVSFVSLEGDILRPNGFLDIAQRAEGEDASVTSLVHRKSEIKELALKQSLCEEELGSLEAFLKVSEKNIEESKAQVRELTAQLVGLDPDLKRHSDFLRQVEAQIARLQEKQQLLKADLVKTSEDHSSNNEALEACSNTLSELEKEKTHLDDQLAESEAKLRESILSLQALEIQHKANDKAVQEVQRDLNERRQSLASFRQELRMTQTREEQMRTEEASLAEEVNKLAETVDEEMRNLSEKEALFASLSSEETDALTELQSTREEVANLQGSVESTQEEWQSSQNRFRDLESDTALHELELKNIQDKIKERYQVALESLSETELTELLSPGDLQEMLDVTVSRERIENLRGKIDRLGKINMVAKEEFDDKRQRFEYLFIQKKDVEDAISQLKEAIERFDNESKERFEQSFNEVNQAFKDTFPVLFGGGNAELRLTDPSNLLESGVEIVAQPPGKKLQSVSLLSGGEKALTAVSLIFGIFSIKPSPFCVLDEVDAPLDDTNVGRFNTQVRNMSGTSQIIMITHHKKTMESSDAMYGVTMEDPGVSKIASAKLGAL
jgi:chromosome segregation protein